MVKCDVFTLQADEKHQRETKTKSAIIIQGIRRQNHKGLNIRTIRMENSCSNVTLCKPLFIFDIKLL